MGLVQLQPLGCTRREGLLKRRGRGAAQPWLSRPSGLPRWQPAAHGCAAALLTRGRCPTWWCTAACPPPARCSAGARRSCGTRVSARGEGGRSRPPPSRHATAGTTLLGANKQSRSSVPSRSPHIAQLLLPPALRPRSPACGGGADDRGAAPRRPPHGHHPHGPLRPVHAAP